MKKYIICELASAKMLAEIKEIEDNNEVKLYNTETKKFVSPKKIYLGNSFFFLCFNGVGRENTKIELTPLPDGGVTIRRKYDGCKEPYVDSFKCIDYIPYDDISTDPWFCEFEDEKSAELYAEVKKADYLSNLEDSRW